MADEETELLRFRSTLRHFPSGVAVVTIAHGTDAHGMTASSFTSVSLDPRLCSVSVNKPGLMNKLLKQTDGRFGISVLHADQGAIADFFARRPWSAESGAAIGWRRGCPVLDDALVWLVCEKWAEYEGGDHTIFVGRVLDHGATANSDPSPLVHHNSAYHRLGLPMAATDRNAGEA